MAKRVDCSNSWQLLTEIITRNTLAGQSFTTEIPGFSFHHYTSSDDPKPHFLQPVIIVVAQGQKLVRVGNQEFHYGANLCFLTGVNMPVTSCVLQASKQNPYLSMSLYLDPALIASLATQMHSEEGIPPEPLSTIACGAMLDTLPDDLLDAFVRLAELAERPNDIPILAQTLLHEIHYRLLLSRFGKILRSLNTLDSQGIQVTKAISWLSNNFKDPLDVDALARYSNMAPSTFYKYFKKITTISPLQYQKRLRLDKAQHLMLSGQYDVTQAAFEVGYESVTQFIREYKRFFGQTPRRNVLEIKNAVWASS